MPKFRKRAIVIDAIKMGRPFTVETKEGTMTGKAGDWLITGIAGEQYPCDNDIFHQTYEPKDWNDVEAVAVFGLKAPINQETSGDIN